MRLSQTRYTSCPILLQELVPSFHEPLTSSRSARCPAATSRVREVANPPARAPFVRVLTLSDFTLIDFFASWCAPCLVEHPLFLRLKSEGVRLHGINYRNKPEEAKAWLARLGDPYERIGVDPEGKAGVEFGISGVPETLVIDRAGIVRLHLRRPITADDVNGTILPMVRKLSK